MYSTHKAAWNKYCGAYIVEINDNCILNVAHATATLKSIHGFGVFLEEVQLLLAPEKKLTANSTR